MTDYLEITLSENLELRCDFKSEIYGIYGESIFYPSIRQSGIKIDTGAHGIIIPLRTLGWTHAQETYYLVWISSKGWIITSEQAEIREKQHC